ncbi:MAG: hypothetical protein IPP98_10320 [Gemmatimonadetes bacterium]|nr:hypothetical protein [Gemmatimonadota bacterium]
MSSGSVRLVARSSRKTPLPSRTAASTVYASCPPFVVGQLADAPGETAIGRWPDRTITSTPRAALAPPAGAAPAAGVGGRRRSTKWLDVGEKVTLCTSCQTRTVPVASSRNSQRRGSVGAAAPARPPAPGAGATGAHPAPGAGIGAGTGGVVTVSPALPRAAGFFAGGST